MFVHADFWFKHNMCFRTMCLDTKIWATLDFFDRGKVSGLKILNYKQNNRNTRAREKSVFLKLYWDSITWFGHHLYLTATNSKKKD